MVIALVVASLLLVVVNGATALGAHDTARLARLSRLMATVTLAAVVVTPLALFITYLAPTMAAPLNLQLDHLGTRALTDAVPLTERLLAFGCAAVPLAVAIWGLLSLRKLFLLFANGAIFSSATSAVLSSLAVALFSFVVTSFLAEAPIGYFLTRGTQPLATVAFSLGAGDLVTLFAASVVGVIARVMSEATRLADENARFV
jgi:hypothetical protein